MATDITTIEFDQSKTITVSLIEPFQNHGVFEATELDFRDEYVVFRYHDDDFAVDRVLLVPYGNIRAIHQTL